jgi:hypothetical protein
MKLFITLFALVGALFSLVTGDGIQLSRSVNTVGPDGGFVIKFDSGCSTTDQYGSNNCDWKWGADIQGSVDAKFTHPLEAGSKFTVDMKIDRAIPWKFTCAACGETCTTTIPIVNQQINQQVMLHTL